VTKASVRTSTVGSFDAIVLETDSLRAVVLPALGARVWELEDKARGRQWIWNCGLANLHEQPVSACYDDAWAGGWEELFPNDAPGQFEGRDLPDHGEWWASSWQIAELWEGAEPGVRLTSRMHVIQAACSKEFRLLTDGATLAVRYGVRSEEHLPFHFLFKQHLPIRLTPDCKLRLPGGRARAVDASFGSRVSTTEEFAWPHAPGRQGVTDLREVPGESSRQQEFLYVRELPEPWCGVDDPRKAASIRMHFDSTLLPYVWLFLTYGGWRGHYSAVLEPCTNLPKDLAEAARLGQSARLEPGQEFTTKVFVTVSSLLPNIHAAPQNTPDVRTSNGVAN
jgi:hypothetical protein